MNKSQNKLLDVLDGFLEKERQRIQKRDADLEKAKVRISDLHQELEGLRKSLGSQRKMLAKNTKAYLKILDEHEAVIRGEIQKQPKLAGDFKAGKISLDEFKKLAKSEQQIREGFRSQLQDELAQVQPVLRSENLAILKLETQILEKNFLILQSAQSLISGYGDFLEYQLKGVRQFSQPMSFHAGHLELKRKQAELLIAETGGIESLQLTIESWEELTLLPLDSRIQDHHISDLEARHDELLAEGFDFASQRLIISYSGQHGFQSWQQLPNYPPADGASVAAGA